ncbi:MAG: amidohydrolase, partial [Bacilli bacterium]
MNRKLTVFLAKIVLILLTVVVLVSGTGLYLYTKKPQQYDREAFINAKIYTVNPEQPWAEAMIIQKDRIEFVGTVDEVNERLNSETKVHDLKGQMILPGFIDSHNHIGLITAQFGSAASVDMTVTKTKKEMLDAVRDFVKDHPDEKVILGMGFNATVFGDAGPQAKDLDAIESKRPVFLIDDGGHTVWVNSKAMEIGGITKDAPDPLPGIHYYKRDAEGNPTGWLVEAQAFVPLGKKLNIITADNFVRGNKDLSEVVSQHGLTTMYDAGMMGFEDEVYSGMAKAEAQGELNYRVSGSYMIQTPKVLDVAVDTLLALKEKYNSELITVNTMKVHYDGTLEAKTGALEQPYEQ